MKIITRKQVSKLYESYADMLKTEKHHKHIIIMDAEGVIRWKENTAVRAILNKMSLNDICPLLGNLGYGKNSEVYRKLYRDMGYSLSGYWEIFYWEANNDQANKYKPNPACMGNQN